MDPHHDQGDVTSASQRPAGVGLTSLSMALERCAESDREDRLFDDGLARALAAVTNPVRTSELPSTRAVGDVFPFMRDFVALRTYWFDTVLLEATTAGCRQVVLLGAGMDARAYRLSWPPGIIVFELDRPDVQAFKAHLIATIGLRPSCARTAVGTDLCGDWVGALRAAGFDCDMPTVWLIEGLLHYLDKEHNDQLMDGLSAVSANGSRLAMDHFNSALKYSAAFSKMAQVLSTTGIAWRSTLDDPPGWLGRYGWTTRIVDLGDVARRVGRALPTQLCPDATDGGRIWLCDGVR